MSDRDERPVSDQEAIALARCYRLLIEKAAEYRRRNNAGAEPMRGLIDEPGDVASKEQEHGSEKLKLELPDK